MTSVWDDPDLRGGNGAYVKFDAIGDTVTGTVVNITAHRWDDGSVSPQVLLDTADGEKTVTAGQVRLKSALAEQRPERGDAITITLSDIEKRSGGKTLKHFTVNVVRAGDVAAVPQAATVEAAPVAAAAQYSPEQLEAMKLLGMVIPA
jgi:hypothetical protein